MRIHTSFLFMLYSCAVILMATSNSQLGWVGAGAMGLFGYFIGNRLDKRGDRT